MLKRILLALLLLVLALVLIGAMMSQTYSCSRSIIIQAKPEVVFPWIGQLENWQRWNPFEEQDLSIETTLGEKTSGVGASQTWRGSSGGGRLVIVEWDPESGVACDMVFVNGENEAPAASRHRLNPRSVGSVDLVWSLEGELKMPVLGGFMAHMADGILGPQLERGLEKLKALSEGSKPPPDPRK
jgi:hypothetical protein